MEKTTTRDPAAWVDEHGDGLYRYALLRLGDPDRAADVVQETFLHALRVIDSFSGRSSVRTWLIGILKHKVADQVRAANRQIMGSPEQGFDGLSQAEFDRAGHWLVAPANWGGEPDHLIENREFWESFRSCLAKLPPGLAEAFLRRELDGQDAAAVQEQLGITPANFWARLHRARSLLRRCLESGWFADQQLSPIAPPTKRKS